MIDTRKIYRNGGGGGFPGGGGGGINSAGGDAGLLARFNGGSSVILPAIGTRWPLAYMH